METTKKIKNNWSVIWDKLKFRYPELTDTDLSIEDNKEEELLRTLQVKTGKTREQLMTEINTLVLEI